MDIKTPDILSSENFTSTVSSGELNNLFLTEHGPSDAKLTIEIISVCEWLHFFPCTLIIKFRNNVYKKHETQTWSVNFLYNAHHEMQINF